MIHEEILGKLAIIRDSLEKLGRLPQGSFEEFVGDFRNVDSALHRLQRCLERHRPRRALASAPSATPGHPPPFAPP